MSEGVVISEAGNEAAAPAPSIDERVPLVDRESAAWGASLLVHLAAFGAMAAASLTLPPPPHEIELAPLEVFEEDELPTLPQEFAASDEFHQAMGALSAMGELAAQGSAPQFSDESLVGAREFEIVAETGDPALASGVDVAALVGPAALESIPVMGAGSVGVTGAKGAVDRLTKEILASLEERPTLVAWLFDQSGSLRGERAAILDRFRRIYQELAVANRAADGEQDETANTGRRAKRTGDDPDERLLTAIVGFGAAPQMLTARPTSRFAEIEAAVESNVDDASGQENVFQAVAMTAQKFRRFSAAKNGNRRVMIVVFTDEAGDDSAAADATAALCRKSEISVYVVGRPAPFGRQTAYVKWIDPDPKFDQRPQWVPVTLGPESLVPELLKLRFAEHGDEELLDSGFGPFALTRLCYETGGLYFATHPNRVLGRMVSGEETSNLAAHFAAFFDSDVMRRYQPDYVTADEYARMIQRNRARRALVAAAQMSWTSPLENVRRRFPRRDEAELGQIASLAQRSAAIVQPRIDAICETLLAGETDRRRESEARWQAGFDLALGRALAVKVRTEGYNAMLAELKQGRPFANERHNTWVLRPDKEFADGQLEETAAKAAEYLDRVVRDHPETPWALLAQRELAEPMGWRWEEEYTQLEPIEEAPGRGRRRPDQPPPQGPPRRDPPPL